MANSVAEFPRAGGTAQDLAERYAIKATRRATFDPAGGAPHRQRLRRACRRGSRGRPALATVDATGPLVQEGYVVVNAAFHRARMKHPGDVAVHHLKAGANPGAFAEEVRRGAGAELLAAFPGLYHEFEHRCAASEPLVPQVEANYAHLAHIPAQKAFALEAVRTRCPAALFALRAGKARSARDDFAQYHLDHLLRLLPMTSDQPKERPS